MSHSNFEEYEQIKNRIIINNKSTVNLFSNHDIVENIKEVDEEMYLAKNAGFKNQQPQV